MRPMDPVRGRRKTARKELTHLPREDRRKTLSEKLKKNQPKRVDFPPQMAEFLLTEHMGGCRFSFQSPTPTMGRSNRYTGGNEPAPM